MIEALRAAQRSSPDLFAEGLSLWLRGDESPPADAAGIELADVILLHQRWLLSHFKQR